jgi:tRNA A37 threonylcarbamoyladenosine biosynthesis protein TsaE
VTAGIVAIEWSERLPELPIAYLQVALRSGITGRQVRIEVVGEVPGWNPQHLEDLCANLGGLTLNQE